MSVLQIIKADFFTVFTKGCACSSRFITIWFSTFLDFIIVFFAYVQKVFIYKMFFSWILHSWRPVNTSVASVMILRWSNFWDLVVLILIFLKDSNTWFHGFNTERMRILLVFNYCIDIDFWVDRLAVLFIYKSINISKERLVHFIITDFNLTNNQ